MHLDVGGATVRDVEPLAAGPERSRADQHVLVMTVEVLEPVVQPVEHRTRGQAVLVAQVDGRLLQEVEDVRGAAELDQLVSRALDVREVDVDHAIGLFVDELEVRLRGVELHVVGPVERDGPFPRHRGREVGPGEAREVQVQLGADLVREDEVRRERRGDLDGGAGAEPDRAGGRVDDESVVSEERVPVASVHQRDADGGQVGSDGLVVPERERRVAAPLVRIGAGRDSGESAVDGARGLEAREGLGALEGDRHVDGGTDEDALTTVVPDVLDRRAPVLLHLDEGLAVGLRAAEHVQVARAVVGQVEHLVADQVELVRDRVAVVLRQRAVHTLQDQLPRLADQGRRIGERGRPGVDRALSLRDRAAIAVHVRDLALESDRARRPGRVVGGTQDALARGELLLGAQTRHLAGAQSLQDAAVGREGADAESHGARSGTGARR